MRAEYVPAGEEYQKPNSIQKQSCSETNKGVEISLLVSQGQSEVPV